MIWNFCNLQKKRSIKNNPKIEINKDHIFLPFFVQISTQKTCKKNFVDGSNHFVTILLRETEKSQQQQSGFRNKITREEQPWLRKKLLRKQLRKLKKLQKKLLKRKRSSFFCKAKAFKWAGRNTGPFLFVNMFLLFFLFFSNLFKIDFSQLTSWNDLKISLNLVSEFWTISKLL